MERTVLVGAPLRSEDTRVVDEHMEELRRLTDTAGGEVVGRLVQRIEAPTPQFYIGRGKVAELRDLTTETGADLVIFDEELKPDQAKNLEQSLSVRVMDRSELILDIFASRARTREAKLQVELAQLEYLLPRLQRMWTHLSRIRGGIGLRGPGETQLETDRRLIGRRIADLKSKLVEVAESRAIQRRRRQGEFRAALVGYTNAGKSSILRSLSGSELFVEDRLFATLDSATRSVELDGGHQALVTDTVGFIRKLPHHLVASFRSTLEEVREADLAIHVIDASHPEWEEHKVVVDEVLHDLELDKGAQVLVFNKVDRLTHGEEQALRDRVRALERTPAVFTSAVEDSGLEALRETLLARVRSRLALVEIRLPAAEGELMAALHREGEVMEMERTGVRLRLKARVPAPLLGRLRQASNVEVSEI
ncbi:MAG: GTPase HflX [Gemmatimonadales bacterium]|nr:MAG: GTPase HflX [Gemmatimonadales bacterium]